MATKEHIVWRKATEEEIKNGLDCSLNKGMIEVSREFVEYEEPILETLEEKANRLSNELNDVISQLKA